MESVLEDLQSEKKRKILEWLSGDYNTRHEELTRTTVENSGLWFLKSPEFSGWVTGKAPKTLICSGIRSFLIPISLTISGRGEINSDVSVLFPVMSDRNLGLSRSMLFNCIWTKAVTLSTSTSITRPVKARQFSVSLEVCSNNF